VEAYPDVAGVVAAASAFVRFRPGLCTLRVAGRSREGRPLYVLTVGRDRPGVRNVLVVAGGLADRRGGGAAALRVAERVALDPALHLGTGAAWHFLLCLDPDGAARTEAGPAVRRTLGDHFLHAFRRPPGEEPENADGTPESAALTALIDELDPVLQCSLRGVEAGGARVLATREVPGLTRGVAAVCAERRVPVRLGAYGLPYGAPAAPGVVLAAPSDADGSTWWRTPLTAVVEVPMWATPGAAQAPGPSADLAARLAALRTTPASHIPDAAEALLAAHPSAWLPVPTQLDTHAALTLAVASRVLS
jgi:hypothetical protein